MCSASSGTTSTRSWAWPPTASRNISIVSSSFTGTLELDFRYFDFQKFGMSRLYSPQMKELFWEPRHPTSEITQREYDLAASLQAATNRYGVAMAGLARRLTGSRNLCMAGGVAQ